MFMSSENSEKSGPYRLLHNIKYKIDWKTSDKSVAWLNISIYYTWKI